MKKIFKHRILLWSLLGIGIAILVVGIVFFVFSKNSTFSVTNAHVKAVVDGDTIIIDTGEYVRLIGIDAPEKGDKYYDEAKDKLRDLIYNAAVTLERDQENKDQYGRLLRYIWVGNEFINAEMVNSGYARSYPYSPNLKYVSVFEDAEIAAKKANEGIWYEKYTTLSNSTLDDFLNKKTIKDFLK